MEWSYLACKHEKVRQTRISSNSICDLFILNEYIIKNIRSKTIIVKEIKSDQTLSLSN